MTIAQEWYELYWTNPGGNIPQNNIWMVAYHASWKPSKLDGQDMHYTAGELSMNSYAMFSYGPLHMDEQVLVDQLELIYNSSIQTQDVAKKTSGK